MLESPFPIKAQIFLLPCGRGLLEIDGNGADIDVLVRRAEIALNQASVSRSNASSVIVRGADEKYQRELTIIRDLPIGLANQLYLMFQPKVDLHLNQCTGAEALIRWQHPTLGFIPPDGLFNCWKFRQHWYRQPMGVEAGDSTISRMAAARYAAEIRPLTCRPMI